MSIDIIKQNISNKIKQYDHVGLKLKFYAKSLGIESQNNQYLFPIIESMPLQSKQKLLDKLIKEKRRDEDFIETRAEELENTIVNKINKLDMNQRPTVKKVLNHHIYWKTGTIYLTVTWNEFNYNSVLTLEDIKSRSKQAVIDYLEHQICDKERTYLIKYFANDLKGLIKERTTKHKLPSRKTKHVNKKH